VVELGRAVDRAGPGAARVVEPLAPAALRRVEATVGPDVLRATINMGDEPAAAAWSAPGAVKPRVVPEISAPAVDDETARLPAHGSRVSAHPGLRSLAVFCDFDGTFSVRDVGSTIAHERLPERRETLWRRYDAGEIDAWEYAELLFDGLDYGPAALDGFLAKIDLDPGAGALVDWCAAHAVPLRILSDGFDHNLERLQAIHGVRFDYTANHLRFDGDLWRIAPGRRNPLCDCGTGCCKRGAIEAHRAAHPQHFVVHIGNGRVSDRCGAEAADAVFAKDTLAPDLDARGVAWRPFTTLLDVVAALDAEWGDSAAARESAAARDRAAAGGGPAAGE
jgi:2-hydroxy-3-keto-5-methylthiopentenyl-1-phosphate phosphatase